MSNFGIRIDLLKVKGAFVCNVPGKTMTKKCVIIPVEDDPAMFLGEKGRYLSMTAVELKEPKYDDTHMVKGDVPKEVRELLTEEQLRALPILGNMRPLQRAQQQMAVNGTVQIAQGEGEDYALPF